MRIAICDDREYFLQELKDLIFQWAPSPDGLFIEIFMDGDSLLMAHEKHPFDVIFLDVVMPILNGIETAREIRLKDKTVKIVFLTFSPEYAIDSYSVKAFHYLLKPIQKDALYRVLDELAAEAIENVKMLTVKTLQGMHRIKVSDVEYIESQNKHVLFVLTDGRILKTTSPLYSYEDSLQLKDGFFRCHRSYIVNIYHIASFNSKEIQMRSGTCISISKTVRKDFENAYFRLMFQEAGDFV